MSRIGVIGGGAWGGALAIQAARAGHEVRLWLRDPSSVGPDRRLPRLPDHPLPECISITAALPEDAEAILFAVPTQHLRGIASRLRPRPASAGPLILCCKGIERDTLKLPCEVLTELQPEARLGVLTGPNFAGEIAQALPAASLLAMTTAADAAYYAASLASPAFRLYASRDLIGAQLGGAAKNVIAIAAGVAFGAGQGENARAALITRGIAELSRLVVALGGEAATAAGLSGLGDLLLTCTGPSSRNYSLGLALGRGERLADVLGSRSTVAEGVATAPALLDRAHNAGVSLPIAETVALLLDERIDLAEAGHRLLSRPLTAE